MKPGKWKRISSRVVHKNPWYYVRQDKVIRPDGKPGVYNVVVSPMSVFVIAVDTKQRVCLVKLFRYPTGKWSIEIPAGNSDGQAPLKGAKRELREEAGLVAKKWKLLGKLQTANGLFSEQMAVYLATGLSSVPADKQAEEGITNVFWVPIRKAYQMIADQEITCAQTVASFLLASKALKAPQE